MYPGSNNPFFTKDQGKPDHGPAGQHKYLKPAIARRLKKKYKITPHKGKGKAATPMINSNSKAPAGLKDTYR